MIYISQYSTAVTHLSTHRYQFTDPGEMDGLVDRVRPWNRTRARHTHGARNQAARDSIHSATQTKVSERCQRLEISLIYFSIKYIKYFTICFFISMNVGQLIFNLNSSLKINLFVNRTTAQAITAAGVAARSRLATSLELESGLCLKGRSN